MHHMAYFVDDIEDATATLGEMGFDLAQTALAGATRFNFIDAVELTGHFFELYEPNDALVRFYDKVAKAAIDWVGSDPVRVR